MEIVSWSRLYNRRRAGALLLVLAMLMLASPAGASSGNHGEGTGTGEEEDIVYGEDYASTAEPFCLEVVMSEYFVDVDGEFFAEDSPDQVEYDGEARIMWETLETYYIGPAGTYTDVVLIDDPNPAPGETGHDPAYWECDPSTLGAPIDTEVKVVEIGSDPGYITCAPDDQAGYSRSGPPPPPNNEIEVTWSAVCTVSDGTDTVTTPEVDHEFDGTLTPCFMCDPPQPSVVVGTWTYSE